MSENEVNKQRKGTEMKKLIAIGFGFIVVALIVTVALVFMEPLMALGLFVLGCLIFVVFSSSWARRSFMPVNSARFAIAIALIAVFACGGSFCATTKAPAPSTASTPSTTSTASAINWSKVSQYYHTYVAGLIAPIGLAAATVADPSAGPAIALASKEVANLDSLLAAKASNETVAAQAVIVEQAVTDANAKVGAVLAATNPGVAPAVPTN